MKRKEEAEFVQKVWERQGGREGRAGAKERDRHKSVTS